MVPVTPEISVSLPSDDQSSDGVVRVMVGAQTLLELERMPGAQALAVACAMRQLVQQVLSLNGLGSSWPIGGSESPEHQYAPEEAL